MSALTVVILMFSILGAACYLFKDKFGLGAEFERGFQLLGTMALSMIGMIVISPLIAELMSPVLDFVYTALHIDPSIIPASLFANDMGGAPLAVEVAKNEAVGNFNAYVVSAMMGCTVSFTVPFALKAVPKDSHKPMILGLLCGVATIPAGCFFAGLLSDISLPILLLDLLPILMLALVIGLGLWFFPDRCIKIFKGFGACINFIIVVGLVIGIVNFLAKEPLVKGVSTMEEGALVCINAAVVMTGMFPLIKTVAFVLEKPLFLVGKAMGINKFSMTGLFSSLATSVTSFSMVEYMDKKGVMLNSAFAVSGAFTFAGHLAFTMAYNSAYIAPMIVGKLIGGVLSVVLAMLLYRKVQEKI